MIKTLLLVLFFSFFGLNVFAQDSLETHIPLKAVAKDSTLKPEIKLHQAFSLASIYPAKNPIFTDSLARWYQFQSFDELLFWSDGLQHFRTPRFIRSSFSLDAKNLDSYWYIDGLSVYSPLGQRVQTTNFPIRATQSLSKNNLNDFQLNTTRLIQKKAVTELQAEESGFGYLNVYGSLYTPISKKQHLEASLWNKSEGAEYVRSESNAKNMYTRYRYQLADSAQFEASLIYTSVQLNEPDGYYVEPISFFDFDRFRTQAHRRSARSSQRNSFYRVDLFQPKTKLLKHISAFMQLERRFFKAQKDSLTFNNIKTIFAADTVDVGFNQYGIQAVSEFSLLGMPLTYSTAFSYTKANQNSYLNVSNPPLNGMDWFEIQTKSDKEVFLPFGSSTLNQFLVFNSITGFSGKIAQETHIRFQNSELNLVLFGQQKTQPMYSKFLKSESLTGSDLPNVQSFGMSLNGKIGSKLTSYVDFTTSGNYESGEYGLRNGNFFVADQQITLSSELDFGFHFWKISAQNKSTVSHFLNDNGFWPNQTMLWNRTQIYHEDYWFKRASFVRTGFSAVFSPFSYATPSYNVLVNDWMQAEKTQEIPGFFRLDYEFNARIRALFIYFRWENITQGLLQNGYFETYSYPMYERRFRFGIKVQFIN